MDPPAAFVPEPSSALPPAELARRLSRYAARAAAGKPLFGPGRATGRADIRHIVCWGCGRVGPKTCKDRPAAYFGWHVGASLMGLATTRETTCPDCGPYPD